MEKSYIFTLLWNKTAKLYRFSMIFDINQLQGAITVQFVGTYFMYVPSSNQPRATPWVDSVNGNAPCKGINFSYVKMNGKQFYIEKKHYLCNCSINNSTLSVLHKRRIISGKTNDEEVLKTKTDNNENSNIFFVGPDHRVMWQ